MNRPNILWITLESVRAEHTSVYGYERDTTPNIRTIAERDDSTTFENGIAQSMWTPASTASILTGTYLSTHRLGQDGKGEERINSNIDTFPERLAESGYRTALFSPNPYISSATGLDRGFDTTKYITTTKESFLPGSSDAVDHWISAGQNLLNADWFGVKNFKNEIEHNSTAVLQRNASRWLNSHKNKSPYFLYAHLPAPHHPYLPLSDYRELFFDDISVDSDVAYNIVDEVYDGSERIKREMAEGLEFTPEEWEGIVALYDAEIRYTDDIADRLVQVARENSDRELIVVITGDHGELFGEHGLIGHNLVLDDNLIHVPLIVAGIDGTATGSEVMTQHIDVTKTLAKITGTDTNQFTGRDIRDPGRNYAISQRGVAHLDAYTKYNEQFAERGFTEVPLSCVRTSEYKYVESNDGDQTLYELPDESTNVASDNIEVVENLKSILQEESITWDETREKQKADFDNDMKERLSDLGYIT